MSQTSDPVREAVTRLSRGRRRVRFVTVLGRSLFYGGVAGAGVAVGRLFYVGWESAGEVGWSWLAGVPLVAALIVIAVSLVAAALSAWLVAVDRVAVAKRYDDVAEIKDLVSTSLQLDSDTEFARAVREDAHKSIGMAGQRALYPTRAPREARWIPAPVATAAAAIVIPILTWVDPSPPDPAVADRLQEMLPDLVALQDPDLGADDPELAALIEETASRLGDPEINKRDALAELAKLTAELEKQREEIEKQNRLAQKASTKLTSGEEYKDLRRDMESGNFKEAANKVRKKLGELEKELEKALKEKNKIEIERLRKQIEKLKQLLAELDELSALGQKLGFLNETLEVLENIEGALGELGEFDGLEVQVDLGKLRRGQQAQELDQQQLLVRPSNEAGEGHAKDFLGKSNRSLTEREESEVKGLRETKGKSQFGQARVANDRSRSAQEYEKAYLSMKKAAEDAIYRQNIPAGYRRYIRRYFEAMQPDERGENEGK